MLDSADVERRIAWRKGLLVFNGQRLGDAAAEVNRYSDLRVTIDDPTLARAEFMGVFKLGDARAFANAAASAFNGEVHLRGNELVMVRQQTSDRKHHMQGKSTSGLVDHCGRRLRKQNHQHTPPP